MIGIRRGVGVPTPPASDQDDLAACATGLGIPRALWSPPVGEARRCRVGPRLSPRLLPAHVLALLAGYVCAACAARGRVDAASWLLGLAVIAIVITVAAAAVHVRRCVGYRAAAPREEFR